MHKRNTRLSIFSGITALSIGLLTASAVHAANADNTAGLSSARSMSVAPDGVINHSCGLNVSAHQGYLSPPKTMRKAKIGAAVVELRGGVTASTVLWWGRIKHAKKGDTVWLDWSDDGHRNWHQCGPFKVRTGTDALTRANNALPGRAMRACGHHAGVTKCTKWEDG